MSNPNGSYGQQPYDQSAARYPAQYPAPQYPASQYPAPQQVAPSGGPHPEWLPQGGGPGAPAPRRSRAPWYVAVAVLLVAAAGATLWLTVFKGRANDQAAAANTPQGVAHVYIEAARGHDLTAAKKVMCKADLDKVAKDPADGFVPDSVTIVKYTVTGQHDVPDPDPSVGPATVIDGSITINDGKSTVTSPLDLPVIKEAGAFKACTSLAIRAN